MLFLPYLDYVKSYAAEVANNVSSLASAYSKFRCVVDSHRMLSISFIHFQLKTTKVSFYLSWARFPVSEVQNV